MANWSRAGTHNRVQAISRGLVPDLKRLTEDCGVCLSSCLDYWEADLILQAFNRCLILAPELYGNPWFLRDDEFPRLARIFNLHQRYRDILVKGMVLDAERYGPLSVARGNDATLSLAIIPSEHKMLGFGGHFLELWAACSAGFVSWSVSPELLSNLGVICSSRILPCVTNSWS